MLAEQTGDKALSRLAAPTLSPLWYGLIGRM